LVFCELFLNLSGIECLISANVSTLKGGSINEASLLKSSRLAEIARVNGLPSINLLQSGGANLTQQEKIFHSGGESFRDLAIRAKDCQPTVCVVFGNATAGGAYTPGMSSYSIFVKVNQSNLIFFCRINLKCF
jgi:acyl-CoA carboxylase subunit beta